MPGNVFLSIGLALFVGTVVWSYWYERRITRAQPPAGDHVDTEYGRMHVIHRGMGRSAGGLRPIVLIHGSTTNALDMDIDIAGRLDDTRDVLIPDRPGHGFSDRPEDGWRLDVQTAAIRAAILSLGIRQPIILGQSYGGAVALRYALDYPDDVAGLVLVAPVTHPWPGGVAWYNKIALHPVFGWVFRRTFIALYGRFGAPKGVSRALRGSHLANRYFVRTRVPMTFRPRRFRFNAEDIVRLYEQLFAMQRHYPKLRIPVECVSGTHDLTVMTSVHSRRLSEVARGFSLKVIEGGGHALHHTHPDEVLAAVERLDTRLATAERSPLQGALRRLTSVFPRSA